MILEEKINSQRRYSKAEIEALISKHESNLLLNRSLTKKQREMI
jgi:hypothetical protein